MIIWAVIIFFKILFKKIKHLCLLQNNSTWIEIQLWAGPKTEYTKSIKVTGCYLCARCLSIVTSSLFSFKSSKYI